MNSHTAGQDIGRLRSLGHNVSHASKNHLLGVISGTIGQPAQNFRHPELIIAGLIYALTRSAFLVALVMVINKAAVFVPQLLLSSFLEHKNRRKPYYTAVTIIRCGSFAATAGAAWLFVVKVNSLNIVLFFVAYGFYCLASGMNAIIFKDMTGRLIFPHRVGSFLGLRLFLGGMIGIIVGLVVIQPILAGVRLPVNYAILLSISTVLLTVSMVIWCFCSEEPGAMAKQRTSLGQTVRRGMQWLKEDKSYRSFLWLRMGFRVSYLSLVFFIPYGAEQLSNKSGANIALLGGLMVAIYQLADVAGSAVWGKVADKRGSRVTLAGSATFMLLAPVLALIAPQLPQGFSLHVQHLPVALDLPLTVYLIGLVALGFGNRGQNLGGNRFLITSSPPDRRPSYLAFVDTLASPLAFLPLLGAWLAQTVGMPVVFMGAAGGALICLIAAGRMKKEA